MTGGRLIVGSPNQDSIRKRSSRITQHGQNTGKSQPVGCLVLSHDQIEVLPVKRAMFGDLPFVVRDGVHRSQTRTPRRRRGFNPLAMSLAPA
ncbi:hypothetical protein N184_33455 [Sinorhizobium sp. GL28]|nr:hypothetical protein N184_33455 [Sinorhizobium sp. GL28]